jgi:hypothetical protein
MVHLCVVAAPHFTQKRAPQLVPLCPGLLVSYLWSKKLDTKDFIQTKVKKYYWQDDINCATTNLRILSEIFSIELSEQVIDAALGMHGAGKYGAQCGLVEGTLMFLGIIGRSKGIPDDNITDSCNEFAKQFEHRFQTLLCKVLRPKGFHQDDPPHLCEELTCEAVAFNVGFLSNFLKKYRNRGNL